MLPRKNRATTDDFSKRDGRRTFYRAPHVVLEVTTKDDIQEHPTIACVVSKKVARHANKRNLLKRHCRAILHELLPSLPNALIVVRITSEADYNTLRIELEGLVENLSAR